MLVIHNFIDGDKIVDKVELKLRLHKYVQKNIFDQFLGIILSFLITFFDRPPLDNDLAFTCTFFLHSL